MDRVISVVVPCHNAGATIGKCLEALFSSDYRNFEVIVVDDGSTDNSADLIGRFPCRLIRLEKHSGASRARNAGASESRGDLLFFTDADCVVEKDTLLSVAESADGCDNAVIGGTYTRIPYDTGFFSTFQSVFVNHSETKREEPDYIATHAMAIHPALFKKIGGFSEDFLPLLEDVEFSHRARKSGYRLVMCPGIRVRHIFNFTLRKSLRNAYRKSLFWTMYSLRNRDLLTDSGTASLELKADVVSFSAVVFSTFFFLFSGERFFLLPIPLILFSNLFLSRGLIRAFYETKGFLFSLAATLYYALLYPVPVAMGAIAGLSRYLFFDQKV